MTDTLPKEAVEAAARALAEAADEPFDDVSRNKYTDDAQYALTAALPHLTPSPLPGEEIGRLVERLREVVEDHNYSYEAIGIFVRNRWPEFCAALSRQPGWNEAIEAAANECERLADIFNKDDRRAETHALERTIAAIRALTRPATDADRIGILD